MKQIPKHVHTRTPRLHDRDSVHIYMTGRGFSGYCIHERGTGDSKASPYKTFKDIYKFPSKGVEALY